MTFNNIFENSGKCPFCFDNIRSEIVSEFNSVLAIEDSFPVSGGHLLIIPKRHCSDYFELTEDELKDANSLLKNLRKGITESDSSVTGFNIGMNTGESAGQTIFHCHIHLIPRRDGDTPNPRGGVRGVIPDKMNY
ncbi:MAG: HIT family protein [Deltaproteobacteria bacterium]|nr:HIT family protein [Deltaproteobacteria bacterium]